MTTTDQTRDLCPEQNHLFDVVIRKPFTPELLMTTVNNCLANPPNPTGPRPASQ